MADRAADARWWGVGAKRETSVAADGPCVAMYINYPKYISIFATPTHPLRYNSKMPMHFWSGAAGGAGGGGQL